MSKIKITIEADSDEILEALKRGDETITLTAVPKVKIAVPGLKPGGKARKCGPRRQLWLQCMDDWLNYQRTLTERTRRPTMSWIHAWFSDHHCPVSSRTLKRDLAEMTAKRVPPHKPDRRDSDFIWIWNQLPDWTWSKTESVRLADALARALPNRRAKLVSPDTINPLPGGNPAWQELN